LYLGETRFFRFVEGPMESARDGPNGFGGSFNVVGKTIWTLFDDLCRPLERRGISSAAPTKLSPTPVTVRLERQLPFSDSYPLVC
jgi:hypothetical protein